MDYVEKSREAIKSIPNLREKVRKLRLEIDQAKSKELLKEYTESMVNLRNYVGALQSLPKDIAVILIEHYCNGLTIKEIAFKYGMDYQKVYRVIKMEDSNYAAAWVSLSVRLFGSEALMFLWEEGDNSYLYDELEDLEEDEDLCE